MASINFEFLREEEDGDRKEDDADKGQGKCLVLLASR